MSNTLYDLLEVNPTASPEAISAAYNRLHTKFSASAVDGNEDATNHLIALREAFHVLSSQERRGRYDQRLATRQQETTPTAYEGRPFLKFLVVAGLVGTLGVGYAKYQSDKESARLERERVAAEARKVELAEQKEREHAEREAAEKAEIQRRRDEATERYNRERDIAYGNQVSRSLQRGVEQARRDQERDEYQRANAERQARYESERQLAREKAYLRQLEAENSRYRRF